MKTDEISPAASHLLHAFADLETRHQAPTVQAAAILANTTFMDAYTLVNELFSAGLLDHDLGLSEAGTKAIEA